MSAGLWRWRAQSRRAGAGRRKSRGCARPAFLGQADPLKQRGDRRAGVCRGWQCRGCAAGRQAPRDGGAGIERGKRVLEHHLQARAQRAQRLRRAARARSTPSKRIVPASGSISRMTMRASVDLPLPDGPTSASVSPRARSRSRRHRARRPCGRRAERSCEIAGRAEQRRAHAGASGAAAAWGGRYARRAARACRDRAAGRRSRRSAPISTSRPAWNTAMRSAKLEASAMSWLMKISDMPSSRDQLVDQRDDLRLDDRVERAGRLVGDQQFRSGGDRGGDCDALLLAAGQLVRIGGSIAVRIGQSDAVDQLERHGMRAAAGRRARCARPPRRSVRRPSCTGSRLAPGSWNTKPMSRPLTGGRPSPGQSICRRCLRCRGSRPAMRQRQRALAGAAFADHGQPLAGCEIETRRRRAPQYPPSRAGSRRRGRGSSSGVTHASALLPAASTTPSPAR